MLKHNPGNERIKRIYFTYLKEAKRQIEQSVDAVAKALSRFEEYTHFKDFKRSFANISTRHTPDPQGGTSERPLHAI